MNNTNKINIHEEVSTKLTSPGYKPEITGDLAIKLLPLPPAIGLPGSHARCPGIYQHFYNVDVVGLLKVGKGAQMPYGRYEDHYYMAAVRAVRDNFAGGGSRNDRRVTLVVEQFEGGEHRLDCSFTEAGEQRTHTFSTDQAEVTLRKKPTLDGERVITTAKYGLCAANIESCQLQRLKGEGDMSLDFTPPGSGNKRFQKSSKTETIVYP